MGKPVQVQVLSSALEDSCFGQHLIVRIKVKLCTQVLSSALGSQGLSWLVVSFTMSDRAKKIVRFSYIEKDP